MAAPGSHRPSATLTPPPEQTPNTPTSPTTPTNPQAEKARARKAEEKKELMSKLEGTNTAVTRGQLKKNGLYERIAL